MTIMDMIMITFFFLLHPGEFTGITSENTPFRLQNVALYIGFQCLHIMTASLPELDATTSVPYTFTTHKNGIKGGKVVHGPSENSLCCPVKATVQWIKYHRLKKLKCTAPIVSYYCSSCRFLIKAKDITDVLRLTMMLNFHHIGIPAMEVSA
jgi:hypothetical protein